MTKRAARESRKVQKREKKSSILIMASRLNTAMRGEEGQGRVRDEDKERASRR